MKTLLLISLILLTSCNLPTKKQKRTSGLTDPYFDDYISEFEDYCNYYTNQDCEVTTTINFVDTFKNSNALARCYNWENANITNEVLVKLSTWRDLDEVQRRVLIAHELGHCELNRGHNDAVYEVEGKHIPLSVMNTYLIYIDEDVYDAFMVELFTHDDSEIISYYNEKYSCDFCSSVLQ